MKPSRLRYLLLAGLFAFPALAHAHPGHDGDHEFVWDFEHLTSHPLATLACITIVAAGGWIAWRLLTSSRKESVQARTDRR